MIKMEKVLTVISVVKMVRVVKVANMVVTNDPHTVVNEVKVVKGVEVVTVMRALTVWPKGVKMEVAIVGKVGMVTNVVITIDGGECSAL